MKVRDAVVDDVTALVRLLDQLSLDGARREGADLAVYVEAFRAIIADPRQSIVVAEGEAGVVVGCATLIILPNLSHGGRSVAQLESVVVDDAFRGRGVGDRIVAACVERARAAGCFRVQLTSNSARSDAHRFWKRCGFVHSHAGFKRAL